eukprot:2124477-Rhodomonas_salina.1
MPAPVVLRYAYAYSSTRYGLLLEYYALRPTPVGEGRRTLEDNVRAELGRVKGALDEKGTTLREQLEGWREGQAAE